MFDPSNIPITISFGKGAFTLPLEDLMAAIAENFAKDFAKTEALAFRSPFGTITFKP